MTDERDLLRAVFATPDDDLPRLVLADWWDEHGQPERAEFVRLAIALDDQTDTGWSARRIGDVMDRLAHLHRASLGLWGMRGAGRMTWASYISPTLFDDHIVHPHNPAQLFRRGWVESVRLPLAAFLGETCGRCRTWTTGPNGERPPCGACSGTGRVGGCAAELFRSQPVTTVTPTCREPSPDGSGYRWWRARLHTPLTLPTSAHLPLEVFAVAEKLGIGRFEGTYYKQTEGYYSDWILPNHTTAVDALSAALVAHGRQLAGLTALPSPSQNGRTPGNTPG